MNTTIWHSLEANLDMQPCRSACPAGPRYPDRKIPVHEHSFHRKQIHYMRSPHKLRVFVQKFWPLNQLGKAIKSEVVGFDLSQASPMTLAKIWQTFPYERFTRLPYERLARFHTDILHIFHTRLQ